jgi:uncharacterized membrane protein
MADFQDRWADLALLVGRLHVLLVHLPIGFLVLLAGLELLSRWPRFKGANASAGFVLAGTVPATFATAGCGWLLSRSGGYEPDLLQQHMYAGFATAAACAGTGLLYWLAHQTRYRWALAATCLALVVAGHSGGSLTHGRDFLTRPISTPRRNARTVGPETPATDPRALNLANQRVFPDKVQPVLNRYCVSCHGAEKAKGGLRLDSLAGVLRGGKHGLAVVPGKATASELIRRLRLPVADDERMPPEGKAAPTEDEVALLGRWIDAAMPPAGNR